MRSACGSFTAGLAVAALWSAGVPSAASAEPCDPDLKVAGTPVTGADCTETSSGAIRVVDPRFGASEGVRIEGTMTLNAERTRMTPPLNPPVVLRAGPSRVATGRMTVEKVDVCDVAPPRKPDELRTEKTTPAPGLAPGAEGIPKEVGCRKVTGVDAGTTELGAGFRVAGLLVKSLKSKGLKLGIDDTRGGRVFGTLAVELPQALSLGGAPVRVGIGAEISAQEAFRLVSGAVDVPGPIPSGVPGLVLRDLLVAIDPTRSRYVANLRIAYLPADLALRGDLAIQGGSLQRLGADLTFSPPFPVFTGVSMNRIGFGFQASRELKKPPLFVGPASALILPARYEGRAGVLIGPPIAGRGPLTGDLSIAIAGPSVTLRGDLFALNRSIKLGSARVLTSFKPFRIEAEAKAQVLSILEGEVFVGVTSSAFTAHGKLQVKVPKGIKYIGGKSIGSAEAAISNKGAGAVVKVFRVIPAGLGITYEPRRFRFITSLRDIITVRPSTSQVMVAAATGEPVALSAAQRRLTIRTRRPVVIEVRGSRSAPRGVRFRGPRGSVTARRLPFGDRRTAVYLIERPPRRLLVSARGRISRIVVSRVDEFNYLDPQPGFGTRPRQPVRSGETARVCWRVRHAPRGARVDLFEDMNGRLATGRMIAEGRPVRGCFEVPTADMEPGHHWVYGVVRVGDVPLSSRYWPVGIEVFDPAALPAPGNVRATPTADGATVAFDDVPGTYGYRVTAEPVPEGAAEQVVQELPAFAQGEELTLRGARKWRLRVQAYGETGLGNPSSPIEVSPSDPVVLAGESGVAQVGRRWALQLDRGPDTALRLVSAPRGMRLDGNRGLLTWTPNARAGRSAPSRVVVEACKADERCLTREFVIPAYARELTPMGPSRGFVVTPSVLSRRGGTLTLHAQGVDKKVTVRVNGRRPRSVRRIDKSTVRVRVGRLRPGSHTVSLRIGQNQTEVQRNAFTVR